LVAELGPADALPLGGLDHRVHGKVRPAILTLLSRHAAMPFLALKVVTQTPDRKAAVHLQKLEAACSIEVTRDFEGRQRRTCAALTDEGRSAYRGYLKELRTWLDL
jgi:hypothetical protein